MMNITDGQWQKFAWDEDTFSLDDYEEKCNRGEQILGENTMLETLAQCCIRNVTEELGNIINRARGMALDHYEIERFCRAIDAVADGFAKTFTHFDREMFLVQVYGDQLLNFEAGRIGSMLKNGMSLERLNMLLYGEKNASEESAKRIE